MPDPKSPAWTLASLLILTALQFLLADTGLAQENGAANAACLACHRIEGLSAPIPNGEKRPLYVSPGDFEQSVHGKRACVECHKDITAIPHRKGVDRKVGCVQCHEDLWQAAQDDNRTQELARLGEVVQQIDSYMSSIHARPNQSKTSRGRTRPATTVMTPTTLLRSTATVGAESRLKIPEHMWKVPFPNNGEPTSRRFTGRKAQ